MILPHTARPVLEKVAVNYSDQNLLHHLPVSAGWQRERIIDHREREKERESQRGEAVSSVYLRGDNLISFSCVLR